MKIDIDALRQIEREKGIDFHTVVEAFETALASAYKRSGQSSADEARVVLDRVTGEVTVYAQELDDEGNIVSEWQDEPRDFGRIVAQTAKQVLLQRLREAEREATYGEFVGREGDIVSGTVSLQGNVTLIELGRTEALMPFSEQVPNERLEHGQHARALVIEVRRQQKGAQIVCSRTHPGLVAAMFALEVPEIEEGIVEIKAIAREAGHRTKVAVMSHDPAVDPVGACVGPGGQRARGVQKELHNEELERIDIIRWADEPEALVANALSPAKVSRRLPLPRRGHRDGRRPRLPAVARDRPGGPERPPRGTADRLAHRHQVRVPVRRGAARLPGGVREGAHRRVRQPALRRGREGHRRRLRVGGAGPQRVPRRRGGRADAEADA